MKLRLITENSYAGLEDSDEFKDPNITGLPPELENFISDGNLDDNGLIPEIDDTVPPGYLNNITGQGRFTFPVMPEHRQYIQNALDNRDTSIPSEFYWALRSTIINSMLKKNGFDEYLEEDWRRGQPISLIINNWEFAPRDPLVSLDVSFSW
jgi:hypothetical protein